MNRIPKKFLSYDTTEKRSWSSHFNVVRCDLKAGKITFPWIQGVYFPTLDLLYFHFYEPDGKYKFDDKFFITKERSSESETRSFNCCQEALCSFIHNSYVSFQTKVLFWQFNNQITQDDLVDDVTKEGADE